MSHHRIAFEDVHFSYPDGTQALKGVSLTITHGESVGIIGANGAGKSTLLLHLNGCLLPTKGRVLIGDVEVGRKTRSEVRKRVGLVFQDPDDQLFMPTVYEDVAFGLLNMGLKEGVVEERVERALRALGCQGLRDRPPHRLSMGQKRAVSIATVMAMEPDILAMDEPTANLDPRSRREVISFLRGFIHTKIIATHDLDLALEVCKRVILLKDGTVKADGPARRILLDRDLLEDSGLELPLSCQGPALVDP